MNKNIEMALNVFYQCQITNREALLNEVLRVKLTAQLLRNQSDIANDKEKLFQRMKQHTEEELGFFPADRDDFFDIYHAINDVDLVELVLEIYKNDRLGTIVSPSYLTSFISGKEAKQPPRKILITEAEKHLSGLMGMVEASRDADITLSTQNRQMRILLTLVFDGWDNVRIVFESIYTDCLQDQSYDYIFTLPSFGMKPNELGREFLTKESDGIALENMLGHLAEKGTLDIIVPARLTFSGMGFDKLRTHIANNYFVSDIYLLPEGTFRPSTSIKTYLFTITREQQTHINIGSLELESGCFEVKNCMTISTAEFLSHEDWRIEILLSNDDESIRKFRASNVEKAKLKEVAEVFRGKSILKKDTAIGKISVLNISNIENGEIDYSEMDTIEEDERKIKRYELCDGDIVLSCRGTAIKTAIFKVQSKIIIASANLIVIRPSEIVKSEYIKVFFDSPVGLAMIKSFQRGGSIMNINHSDIMEMEIPFLPIKDQQEIAQTYSEELDHYKVMVKKAEQRWNATKNKLFNKLS